MLNGCELSSTRNAHKNPITHINRQTTDQRAQQLAYTVISIIIANIHTHTTYTVVCRLLQLCVHIKHRLFRSHTKQPHDECSMAVVDFCHRTFLRSFQNTLGYIHSSKYTHVIYSVFSDSVPKSKQHTRTKNMTSARLAFARFLSCG